MSLLCCKDTVLCQGFSRCPKNDALIFFCFSATVSAQEDDIELDEDIGKSRDGSRTDDEVVQR